MRKLISCTFALTALLHCRQAVHRRRFSTSCFRRIQPLTPASACAACRPRRMLRANGAASPGASGHPLMTADAIRAAAADFPNCIEPPVAGRGEARHQRSNRSTRIRAD